MTHSKTIQLTLQYLYHLFLLSLELRYPYSVNAYSTVTPVAGTHMSTDTIIYGIRYTFIYIIAIN